MSTSESAILNAFKDGVVVVLRSEASGKNLRTFQDGRVEGRGGEGELAQFKVHVRRQGVVALQNISNPNHWIRIKDNRLDGLGKGGPFTEFKLEEHSSRVVFESVKFPGQHVGIVEIGEPKNPGHTGTGKHSQFQPKVIRERNEIISSGTSHYEALLAHGNIIVLESVASGKAVRVMDDGRVEGSGGMGAMAQFIVHVRGELKISLQCAKNHSRWLAIKDEQLRSNGEGGPFTELKIDSNDGNLVLESAQFPRSHVGVKENGGVKKPNHTRRHKHGQFRVKVIREQPDYHRAGPSLLERTLHHGNRVLLYSKASGKTLRILPDGRLDGRGGEGEFAQFIVHVRCQGVVALQNMKQPHLWLQVSPHELTAGSGERKCELTVKSTGNFLVFSSEVHPGHHVGVLPTGDIKPPQHTGTGDHAQFSVRVKKDSPFTRASA